MTDPITHPNSSRLLRAAIWVAIGALIAAAIVCVVWVLLGDSNGMVGRAFLTILLLASFAGVAILESNLASRRPAWFALASMVTWVVILLIGAFLIWMPQANRYYGEGMERFAKFLGIVLILQLALLLTVAYGSLTEAEAAWTFGDIGVGLMAWLNIIAILILQKPAIKVLKDYETQRKQGIDPQFDPRPLGIRNAQFWEERADGRLAAAGTGSRPVPGAGSSEEPPTA